ncbi:mechanosensitive ion channel protein MscS [Rhizocola hellebori]|uniref:Mechanosensitive ion channel protein MscS n=1 Tax=Rhizocola hellebori TaxID=1392758 RepID=A0A8J3QH27_9ACTN|nr:mechanosensitive ion channel family protein [Rhizocola hellebori]GIH09293.1 mechanosensitive ion channel protein MscS [Rhizocola hellebori]
MRFDQCTNDTTGQQDKICQWLYERTGAGWLADGGYYLLVQPSRVVLILVIAIVVRALLNHTINRIVTRAGEGKVPAFLRPLREKMPTVTTSTSLFPERRRQRAAAIGSVLKSMVTAAVFAVAFLMILDVFGFNLAPLLTSLGIVGVALGFGAQTLVKDLIAGLFMLLEDQYGVGDVIDTGEAVGVVESVGLRTVTIRDVRGVLWYVRNGEIIRIGNKSQGWAQIIIDVPVGFGSLEEALAALREGIDSYVAEGEHATDFLEPPQVLGVEQITVDGAVIRVTCKTSSERQWEVQRELRRRLTEVLEASGISAQMIAARAIRPTVPTDTSSAQP